MFYDLFIWLLDSRHNKSSTFFKFLNSLQTLLLFFFLLGELGYMAGVQASNVTVPV